jgi:hypothetical protein
MLQRNQATKTPGAGVVAPKMTKQICELKERK